MEEYKNNISIEGSLKNKAALVTGGTKGIGRAIARFLKEQGAHVFIVGSDQQHLADALESIKQTTHRGSVVGMVTDISTPEGIELTTTAVDKHFDRLDVLVNCFA